MAHTLIISPHHISTYHGGQERYCHQLAQVITSHRQQVTYLTSQAVKTRPHSYPVIPVRHHQIFGQWLPSFDLIKQVGRLSPDNIIISLHTLPFVLLGIYISQVKKIPVVHMYLAPSHPPSLPSRLIARLAQFLLFLYRPVILVLTHGYSRRLIHRFPSQRIAVINPILAPIFFTLGRKLKTSIPANHQKVLFVSNLDHHHYYKGFSLLLTSISSLKDHHLIIIGKGRPDPADRRLMDYLHRQNRLTHLSGLSDTQLKNWYHTADVTVLPSTSTSEGFGLVALESLSQGTPVITTTCAGIAPLLKRLPFALIIPPGDIQALTQAIGSYRRPAAHPAQAVSFARQFGPDRMSRQLKACFKLAS